MAKGPIKSTLAAKKARKLVTTEGSKRLEKKAAKKELKSAGANMQRVMSAKPAAGSAKSYSAMVDTLKAGTRANVATRRAVDTKVSAKAATKAVAKGQKSVLKGDAKRTKANAKDLKKVTKVQKKFGM